MTLLSSFSLNKSINAYLKKIRWTDMKRHNFKTVTRLLGKQNEIKMQHSRRESVVTSAIKTRIYQACTIN